MILEKAQQKLGFLRLYNPFQIFECIVPFINYEFEYLLAHNHVDEETANKYFLEKLSGTEFKNTLN